MSKVIFIFCAAYLMSLSSAFAFDLGLRAIGGRMQFEGNDNLQKYFELELYGDYKYSETLAFRGSLFGRSVDGDQFFGGQLVTPLNVKIAPKLFSYMAPGYRFMSRGFSAPTLEAGLNLSTFGDWGLGYRLIFNEWVKNGLKNETQFFISCSFEAG